MRMVDRVKVSGKSQCVELFEVFNTNEEPVIEAKVKTLPIYNQALAAFANRQWNEALEGFSQCRQVLKNDRVVNLYIERTEELLATPPAEDWDGLFLVEKVGVCQGSGNRGV